MSTARMNGDEALIFRFIQAKIISLLNHKIVRGYPEKPDLMMTLKGLTEKESI